MRMHQLTPLRAALGLLLVASAILFLVGSTIERNQHHETTPVAQTEHSESGEGSAETGKPTGHIESGSAESSGAKPGHAEASHTEAGAKILGVNTESLALSIVAVVLSVLLAASLLLRKWSRLVLLAVLGFGLVFAAGDAREVVHQLDESNSGLAAVAAILIALHVSVAVLAGLLLLPRLASGLRASEAM